MPVFYRLGALALALILASGCAPATKAQGSPTDVPDARVPARLNAAQRPAPPDGVERFVSREAWGAVPAAFAMVPHTPHELTIHHTAVLQRPDLTPEAKMLALQRFSLSSDTLDDGRAKVRWADVPYHFYIAEEGTVLEGRDVRVQGDTNTGYDLDGKIQIVVEGNFMEEQPTEAQMASLLALSHALAARYRIPASAVAGHRDHRGTVETSCPGDALVARFGEIRRAVAAAE